MGSGTGPPAVLRSLGAPPLGGREYRRPWACNSPAVVKTAPVVRHLGGLHWWVQGLDIREVTLSKTAYNETSFYHRLIDINKS